MTLRSLCQSLAAIALLASGGLIAPETVFARTEGIRWTHADPSTVQSFEALVRAPDGSDAQVVSIGSANPNESGIFSTAIEVGVGDKLISMRAVSTGGDRSTWSDPPQTRTDDTPPPPPPPSGSEPGPGITITPTPNADARFDFANTSPGNQIAWWLDTQPNYSLSLDDSIFDAVELGSNRVLHTDSAADNTHAHVTGTDNVWSDFEVRGRMAIDRDGASIGVTTYSQFLADDVYYRLGSERGGAFVLEARPNSINCSSVGADVTPQPGNWYRFKLDVQDMGTNNQIRAKVWREDMAEPSGYALQCVDSSPDRPQSGRIGVWSADGGEKYWDDFEVVVATGGGGGGGTPAALAAPVLIQIVPRPTP